MMKIVAMVMCMSVLVASQDLMGDGFGGLMALNLLSGRSPFNFNGLFGGAPMAQQAQGRARTQGGAARQASAGVNPLAGLFVLDVI